MRVYHFTEQPYPDAWADHGGSLRNPAAWNNVFGFRASYGRVPAQGLDVFYAWMGVQGPMARNVPDLAMLLSVQSGYDPRLPLSNRQDSAPFTEPLKRDLKAGKVSIHDLLLEPPEYVHSAKVFDLLLAVPKYGRVKVNKVLQLCRISPSKTIGGLSPRQRTELVSMLRR